MGMDVGGSKKGVKSDINITPLVDVVLVLLIIFMVVTPLAQRGYDLEVPREEVNPIPPNPEDLAKQVILSINEEECNGLGSPLTQPGLPPGCTVRLNKDVVRIEELARKMDEVFRTRKKSDKVVFLAAEEKLNYEGVMRILDIAKNGAGEDLKVALVKDSGIAHSAGGGTE
jgi:biopolymer transport protein TolR